MLHINTLSWLGDKLESFGEWFKKIVNKYIGSGGITAMLITLVLIVIAIVIIKKFSSR